MSRYIEYHDICSAINNQQDGTGMTYEALAHAMVEIQLAPSIDIVRCKECKHASDNKVYGCMFNHFNDNDYHIMYADDYCSYGERREP